MAEKQTHRGFMEEHVNNAVRNGWRLLVNKNGQGWRKGDCPKCGKSKVGVVLIHNNGKQFLLICGSCHEIVQKARNA